jgi:hypothetical protein
MGTGISGLHRQVAGDESEAEAPGKSASTIGRLHPYQPARDVREVQKGEEIKKSYWTKCPYDEPH